jgi:hypothetical protein
MVGTLRSYSGGTRLESRARLSLLAGFLSPSRQIPVAASIRPLSLRHKCFPTSSLSHPTLRRYKILTPSANTSEANIMSDGACVSPPSEGWIVSAEFKIIFDRIYSLLHCGTSTLI